MYLHLPSFYYRSLHRASEALELFEWCTSVCLLKKSHELRLIVVSVAGNTPLARACYNIKHMMVHPTRITLRAPELHPVEAALPFAEFLEWIKHTENIKCNGDPMALARSIRESHKASAKRLSALTVEAGH